MAGKITIERIIASSGIGAFFFDDQAAIKNGAVRDGANYFGKPVTAGFSAVREASESVSIMLILSDGYIARGDCASVQYTGVGGREPRFHARDLAKKIELILPHHLCGMRVENFSHASRTAEEIVMRLFDCSRAVSYGLSQALLDASSHAAGHHVMARVIQDEWKLDKEFHHVPIYGQSGEDRYTNVDKMILKQVPVLPHALINTPELVGENGTVLNEYVKWIKNRIKDLKPDEEYHPVIHLDVYGMVGQAASGDISKTADILQLLESSAGNSTLRIEHPIDAGSRDAQIEVLYSLRQKLKSRGSKIEIIADEWANTAEDVHLFASKFAVDHVQIKTPDLGALHNTVDAIIDCKNYQVGPVLGGTCAETDISARATTNIGVATGVTQMLAKPGMGFDEGFCIVNNEMHRLLRLGA